MTWKNLFKIYAKYIVGGVFFILFFFFMFRTCRLYDENSVLKGKYEAYRAIAIEDIRQAQGVIAEQEKKIKALDEKQKTLEASIEKKNGQIKTLNLATAELEKQRKELTDKDEIIANLDAQIAAWKEKFFIAQSIIEEKDKIIFSLTEKYEAQIKISNSYKLMYEDMVKVNAVAELRIKRLERELRTNRFTGNLGKVSMIALIGLTLYILSK